MKNLLLFRTGICLSILTLILLSSCTKQDTSQLMTQQDVLEQMSNKIGVPTSNMTLDIMPSTALGKFQENKLVSASIAQDGQFAMIAIDESSFTPGYYEFISFQNSISEMDVDFVMLMTVKDDTRARMVTNIGFAKKATAPTGPRPSTPTLPKLGLHCAGAGVCFIMRGGRDNCSYGDPCGDLEDLPGQG